MNRKYKGSYLEQRFRNRIYEAVIRALQDECKQNGWKRKDLAERAGKKESQISRWLSGPGNWTLDTISNLLHAIDAELDFKVTKFKDKKKKNEFHPLNTRPPSTTTSHSTTTLQYLRSTSSHSSAGTV